MAACQYPEGCKSEAGWSVGVGTRKANRQLSCGRHLSPTCTALAEGDHPRRVTLTVVRVRKGPR